MRMGQITRISTRDYRTEPQFDWAPHELPKYMNNNHRPTPIEILREHVDLLEGEHSVALATTNLIRGKTESGKKWTRWDNVNKKILTVKPNKAGVMRVNFLSLSRGKFFNHSPRERFYYDFLTTDPTCSAVDSLLRRTTPERHELWSQDYSKMSWLFYPALTFTQINDNVSEYLPRLRVALREENAINMAIVAFGKKHYRKDLVKAMASCTRASNIELAISLRHCMKTDWLVEIMRQERAFPISAPVGAFRDEKLEMSDVVLRIPEARRRRFILSMNNSHTYFNHDAFRMAYQYLADADLSGIRTIEDLHDLGVNARPRPAPINNARIGGIRYEDPKPFEIELNDRTKLYDGIETEDGLKIVAPLKSETVDEWSSYMGNCIRSYANTAKEGRTNLGGVYKGNKLVANFEIDPQGNLKQLLGKYNQHLELEMQSDIIDALEDVGAITDQTVSNAWGVDLLTVPGY